VGKKGRKRKVGEEIVLGGKGGEWTLEFHIIISFIFCHYLLCVHLLGISENDIFHSEMRKAGKMVLKHITPEWAKMRKLMTLPISTPLISLSFNYGPWAGI
jgi:hypothetical protein